MTGIPDPVLDGFAVDIARLIESCYPLGVRSEHVRPHLVGFLTAVLGEIDGGAS